MTPSIKGFKIGNNEIKIILLAADMTLLLQDLTTVKNVLNTLAYFHKCSGLKINLDKSNTKYIRSLTDDAYFPHGLSWIKTPLETLDISIVDNSDMNYKLNFQQRIVTLKSTLNIWKQRNLSIKGKITILNTLALAPLTYVSSVIETPIKAIQDINIDIQDFMWDGSTLKCSQRTLIQSINNGGLKLCHFETKIQSLQLSWVEIVMCHKS